METREAFSLLFPDRDPSSRKTFCAHVHNVNNMEHALPETRTILVGGGVEDRGPENMEAVGRLLEAHSRTTTTSLHGKGSTLFLFSHS